MKYKIVVDSSCDLPMDYIKDKDVGFQVVPLTIRIDGIDFVDDDTLDVTKMMDALNNSHQKATTSCPSPYAFSKAYEGADNVICITISSKLSGSFNAAFVGAAEETDQNKVHVIDSQAVAGTMALLVDRAYQLMKQDLKFEEICNIMDEYQKSLHLLFVLNKFDNLVKAGRMSKIAAFVASSLLIKPLCVAENGDIKIYKKLRTLRTAFRGLVEEIKNIVSDPENRTCIITYVQDDKMAPILKEMIMSEYKFKDVRLSHARGLCSFYSLEGGIIVSF